MPLRIPSVRCVCVAVLAVGTGTPRAPLGGAALATGYAVLAVLPRSGLGFGVRA